MTARELEIGDIFRWGNGYYAVVGKARAGYRLAISIPSDRTGYPLCWFSPDRKVHLSTSVRKLRKLDRALAAVVKPWARRSAPKSEKRP